MKTLLITSNKESHILKNSNKLQNIKYMTFEELYKKLYFDYNNKTIFYLMTNYKIKYDVAKTYLDALYNIQDVNDVKMDKLKEIKEYLDKNNLLIYDNFFKNYLKNTNVVIDGYSYLNNRQINAINLLKTITNVEIIEKNIQASKHSIYKFNNVEEEVFFIANQISELLETVNINDIKLVNVSDIYYNEIKIIFKYFNIPITIDNEITLYETTIASYFLNNIEDKEVLENISKKFKLENEELIIYNKIINIINEFYFLDDLSEAKEILTNIFKNTKLKQKQLKNKIEITTLDKIKDEYVFLINFNQGQIPTIKKDERYFSDDSNLNFDTSVNLNKIEKQNTIDLINKINNLTISYKIKNGKDEFYISSISDELDLEYMKYDKTYTTYSKQYNEYLLAKKIDNLVKYGTIEKDLDLLYSNYKIDYNTYDNKYTNDIKNINKNIRLSYSSMDNFYKCSYRYYLNNILKIGDFKQSFSAKIGDLFHLCLEDNLSLDKYEENKTYEDSKQLFFLNKLKKDLEFIIETIKNQNKFIDLKNVLTEHKVEIKKQDLSFIGFVDKIVHDDNTLAIIDYKTGTPDFNFNNIIHGLDLQLPVYLYLVKNSNFKDYKIAGFYLQKILPKEITRDIKKNYLEAKKDQLKLQGYSNSDFDILSKFDNSYIDSNVIKSMKVSKNGFYSYSKVLNNNQIEEIIKLVDKHIDNAYKNIIEANFDINPKKIDNENKSCKFCEFSDICYMNESNLVNLKKQEDLSFLGGDDIA